MAMALQNPCPTDALLEWYSMMRGGSIGTVRLTSLRNLTWICTEPHTRAKILLGHGDALLWQDMD
jgi:hypothetical protein